MALKRWAVRQISGLLSDYLEGITEQNLQASLSLEVGEVEIRHVRVHSELLGSLQLLSSDVSVSARIPWRNLGSEPTVITVQNVWVEVQAAKGDEQTAREELRRWRARKRRSVEAQVERARAQAEEEPRRGVAARFGHAALRQLQVRVEGLKARVHPEAASSMDLSITRLALDEGCGDDSVPAEVRRHVASLDKVLELVGLSCHLCRREADSEHWSALRRALEEKQRRLESSAGSDGLAAEVVEIKGALMQTKKACPLMGPLSLDARLWHSRAGGVLWLQTELQVAPSIAALCLSPSNMEYISNIWNWYTEHFSRPRLRHDEQVPTCSGPDYAELCVRRARGEEQEGDQQRLEEIEDLAPVEWLARWQKSVEAPEAQPRGRRWLRPWRQVPEEDDIEDIVEEAGKQSFFEEVEGPRRLELRVVIPTCRILSLEADAQSAHDLRLEGGVQGQLSLSTAREGAMRDFMKAAWDADVSAKLSSIAVLLGDEPLMLLRHSNNEQPPSPPKRQASQDDEDEFFDVESDVEDEEVWNATESAAVNLLIRCARFGGSTASGGAALPWDFRVRLKQEPFRFLLAPQTTHSALNLVLSVIRAATLTRVPAQKVLTDPHSPMAAQEEEFEAIALDLDLDVAAPVFRWDLSEGHVTVALGRLVFRSSQAPPPQQLSPPERCDWRKFACFCQLTETSITVGEKSVECRVYEPSTMSLRAWREADSWHWTLDSQAVRWVIDPLFMQVTGQLPVSFDYAISPLRDVLSDTVPISGDARSDEVPTADVTVEQVTESAKPKTHFKLAIASTEFVLCPAAGQKVSLSLDGISAQYCGYEGRHDVQGEVASCHLSCDSVVLVSFTRGASLEAKSAQDVHVKAGSTLIAVQWYERYIRLAMLAVDEASKALAAGHEVSQRLLPPVDAGIFAQLWGRYVIRPIQARVKERAARRLKELLPGVEEDATVEEENPQPRGRCSVEVNLFYEGLTVSFPGAAEKAPVLQLGVSGAECQIQGFQSGDAVVAVSLVAVNLELDGRRLLTPRRGDKLLRVRIFRRGKHSAIQWTASWAQICILFRQRDYDRLVAHVTAAVQDAMPSRKKAEVANVSVTDTGGQSEESVARSGAKFRLDIGAPLVFLPTDGRCLSTSRLPATGAHEGGQLEIDQGEPTFRPLEGEGCLVLDFGHVAARGGGSSEDVQLQLRGAQVLGVTSNSRQEVLWPVSMQAVLQMPKDGPVEFHAVSMEADGGGAVDHHMSLSRANLTLILDVLAENVCYAGRSGHVGTSLLPQPTTQNQKRRSGFCFSWRWPGELIFDVSFTETVPLGRLRLRGGMLGFSSMPTGTMYQLHSSSMTAIDVRTRSRNRVKTLLECAEGDAADGLGFRVDVNVPMDADTVAVIQLQKPAMHVLPQLVMDLVTAGLSSWQHCTFRNDRAALLAQLSISGPGKAEPEKPDKRGTRVQVNFLDGTFRIAEKWAEPTEHFEFAGSFLIHIFVNMEGIRIERFDLEGGALRLRSAKRSTTTLCPCLEWLVRGDQRRVDDFARMKRHTTYDLRSVIVPPYAIRMSARDHRAMVNAFLEFLSMDAESAEPDCETRSRDPLVLQLVENRLTLVAEVAIEGAEVQVMGEEGGNEWPGLCANARCQLLQVTVDNRQGSTPTINIFGRELEIDISARNHRLGVWEPVLSRCSLRFSYHMQRKPDGGPRDVVVRGDVAAIKPVKVIISAPFVHLANRVFKESSEALQYGHLFSAVNISGLTCQVSVDDAESLILPSSAKAQPLDGLLKGRGRAAIGATPSLVLRLLDEEAEECRLLYGREADQPWDTKTAGVLMCRLVMPRPPQLILIITSTVCVWNRSPADLEVRFLSASEDMAPVLPTAQHCTDARIFDRGDGDAVPAGDSGGEAPDGEAVDGAEGVLQLKAGQLLSAPLAAQLRMGQSILQVRPATGVRYKWSEPFFSVPTNADTTICASPPDDMEEVLPKNWLHLTQRCGGSPADPQIGGWSHVEVQAPFTVINACPCDVLCQFNPRVTKRLMGKEKERLPVETSNIELVVDNGFGGEILIPNNGQAEVMPLRLDEEGYFRWLCNGREGRSRPRWRLNALLVVLNSKRGEVEWHCIQAVMPASTDSRLQLRIPPQNMLPAFEFLAEDLTISLAVRDQQGHASSWSLPLKAVISGPSTEVVQLEFKGMWITLNALRNQRELVIYNRWWFVNSTGLDVRLLQPGGPGPMHPVASFSNKVSLLPEIQNEAVDGVAFVGLRSHAPVEVRVPDVNGAVPVSVTALHPCCLRTEAVTLPEAMRGVPSCLVSLVPAMMVFNHTELEIGFRQYNCPSETALWVSSGLSRALWWHSTADQVIQMAARKDENAKRTWSVPFELKESNIGAYPMVLKCGPSRQLFCVCLDYDAASLAVTVKDASFCHTLTNKHPELKLLASMEGVGEDPLYSFEADFGHTAAFGGRGLGSRPRLRLAVQHCLDPAQKATVMVDLHRSGIHRVPLCSTGNSVAKAKRKSTLRVSAAVSVVLRNRVALVSVTPGIDVARQGPQNGDEDNEDSTLRTLTGELRVDSLCIALVVEGPSLLSTSVWGAGANAATEVKQRREAFTVNLSQVQVQVSQTPDKSRNVDFQIWDVQVDMQHPRRDVILKSTSQPAVRTHTRRDDVRMLDAHLREVQLVLGNLEVSVSGALMDQGRMLRRNLTLGAGLTFADVLVRGKGALHLSNPPPASSKLVVNKLKVGDAKVDVWCQLHLPDAHYLPKSLRDTIQVVSLGTSRLDVKGAQVKLPQQVLFEQDAAEGNFSIVFERVCQHYLPLVKACWRSLLQHSNIFLGGLLSRHTWNPRQRRTWPSVSPVCRIGPHGELILNE